MKKVVGYLRISTASQIDNTSIEMQREKIELYCKLNNIELVNTYVDEGWSAKDSDRPSYNKMIEFVSNKENGVDTIIVYKADRIHRSLKNLMIMVDYLQEIGIGFISLTEQFNTNTAQGLLFLQMIGSFSEFERKLISERTHSGRVAKGKKNLFPGGRIPLGYKLVENDMLLIKEDEAIIVKNIFKLRSKGVSYERIGRKYNFTKQRIAYILSNPIYTGVYKYDGKIEKNRINLQVPPIISRYMWNKVNSKSS
ncbi:recombinase family protein [Paraclostridium bifermentans]|jgi:site-specific DNA recombinase|uniref:recombinase family protein n=1 Tax=Paraclostridium bifermentans TaxID=1490 RepID=UPI001896D39D|nr:recombinase family protein [Paraclostridium bifermentans]